MAEQILNRATGGPGRSVRARHRRRDSIAHITEPYLFDPDVLSIVADREQEAYRRAEPFPHVVLDGLFPDALLDEVVREAPTADESANWVKWDDANSINRGLRDDWTMGSTTRLLLGQFNSAPFLNFLERLTGISGLIPDPHFHGGGIHTIESGGYLRVHADFNHYARLNLWRRINALLYLNRDWDNKWGGHLELWDRTLSSREAAIAPVFNRLVIFSITDTAYHGHPNPLETPPGIARQSLALYYYSVEGLTEAHSTLWQPGVGERVARSGNAPARVTPAAEGDLAPANGTDSDEIGPAEGAIASPVMPSSAGPRKTLKVQTPAARSTKQVLRDWVPPVVWRAAYRVKASLGR